MSASDTYILFELASSTYGVRSEDVQHIDMLDHITPVPNTSPVVDGVVFSRGQVVPALNLRARFGLPRATATAATRLIFIKVQRRIVALVVDRAREFHRLAPDSIRPIDQTLHGIEGNYVQGVVTVGDRLVLLLDVGAILRVDEIASPTEAETALDLAK